QFAVGREAVNALAGRTAITFARTLAGNAAEELALGVLAAALVPVIARDGHVFLTGHPDDVGVRESERTARNPVVSGTPERMAVHLPKEDRLAVPGGLLPGLPQVRHPRNLGPLVLGLVGLDKRLHVGELLGT